MNLTASIKRKAVDLGFDLVGVTTADPPPHAAAFRQWLADGCHGQMNYLARRADERCDPQRVLPGAQSIIVVGQNYCPAPVGAVPVGAVSNSRAESAASPLPVGAVSNRDRSGIESPPTTPRLARYAAGPGDYHDTMGAKLAQLAALVDGIWYVDTGPLLERDLAQRAGLGWIGKHTNLINRQLGNWFFLGVVLTKQALPPDEPAAAHCGHCARCLTACPTSAIVAPYRLDARRCISYLTIELKGNIPVELRPAIGDRVFGCDDCLAVCPWNRFARPAITPRELPPLPAMLSWDDRQFADCFRGTPVYRLKRARWLRNICVVLGNTGNPAVARALDDPDPLVREHAGWAVQRIATSVAGSKK